MRGVIVTGNHGAIFIDIGEKPKTNADRIRALSDEELAKFMNERNACLRTHLRTAAECEEYHNCKDCWLDWLKQEAIE